MAGYSPAGCPECKPHEFHSAETVKRWYREGHEHSFDQRLDELEQKGDLLGSIFESVAKFFGYKPKCK